MTRDQFVSAVLQNAMTVQGYLNGADGRGKDHLCDCIGLIIGAFKILGLNWPGVHGTNWTSRNYINGLEEFQTTLDLRLGDVVLKARDPGQDGYSLPDTYKNSPDKRDYYHIGVVTNMNPFTITHCTTVPGGIQTDKGKKNWKFKGVLKAITEGGGTVQKAIVIATQGNTVNMRSNPSKAATILTAVPVNEEVDLINEGDVWSQIRYKGINGYMMTEFLCPVADDTPPDETEPVPPEDITPGDEFVTIKMPESLALALWEVLDGILGKG